MICWSFPRRARANGNGDVGVGAGGFNDDYRRLGRVAALEAGLTLVESADETTNVLAIIIYDSDAINDAIEVAATSSPRDSDAVTDATVCSDSSWGEEEEEEDDDIEVATPAAIDAASDDSRDLRRAMDAGAHAIEHESGWSLPVAIPVERNDDLRACRRRRLLRSVTPNSAVTRARRTVICPRTGGRRN